ncbi:MULTISPECIES: SPOR domain-containing protein [Aquimarina]|nr:MULTISPECIES: SPOR domain-containing protein [Aquimarina]
MRMLNMKGYILLLGFCYFNSSSLIAQDTINTQIPDSNGFVKAIIPPRQEASVTINQDPRIKMLLDLKSKMEKDGEFSDRYKIQLYYGNLNKANEIMRSAKENFPDWSATMQWETPNYKVWIGNYRTRLDADKALKEIHAEFPNAFIFKPE